MIRSKLRTLLGSTSITLALAGVASADVTAQQVWDNWKNYSESFGQEIIVGSETKKNHAIVVRDLGMEIDFPEGKASGSMDFLEFRELGDGTVSVTMSEEYQISMSGKSKDGDAVDFAYLIRQTGMSVIASGDADAISYAYNADEISVSVDKFIIDGKDIDPDVKLALSDVEGQYDYVLATDDKKTVASNMTAAVMDLNVHFKDPENDGEVNLAYKISDLAITNAGTLPATMDFTDPTWIFGDNFSVLGNMSTGPGNFEGNFTDGSNTVKIIGSSNSSSLDVAMDKGAVQYGGGATELSYKISGSQIPFPVVEIAVNETAFKFAMPLSKSDAPSDFALITKFVGLSVNDDIWGMFDPAKMLPRDPATLIIDIAGKMNWLVSPMDQEATAKFSEMGKPPVEFNSVSLNDITLSIAGAEVKGTGAFTFDNSDTTTFDGLPAPDGAVDLTIVGVNGLMDKLSKMGFLPQDKAMGARMMLGLFARPGDGPDTLTSKIEVKPNGSVFANGQQIK